MKLRRGFSTRTGVLPGRGLWSIGVMEWWEKTVRGVYLWNDESAARAFMNERGVKQK